MEKIRCGLMMSTKWTDPPLVILATIIVLFAVVVPLEFYFLLKGMFYVFLAYNAGLYYLIYHVYLNTPAVDTKSYLRFKNKAFAAMWEGRMIPASELVRGYIDDLVEFVDTDVLVALQRRDKFVSYRITPRMIHFLLCQFIPVVGISSSFYDKATSKHEIADHYNRHSDFFAAFLGPSMVYTCGIFKDPKTESLESAQERKLNTICKKLQMKPGFKFLDIGCGWGTLARFAEKSYGAKATGVTLSSEGARFAREANKRDGVNPEILELDYRDIPADRKFDAISAIEMAEHVGLVNFNSFLTQTSNHLNDDGLFLMQVAGLRQGAAWQDVAWGLFMSQYIFPGADASTPLHWYVRQMEQAGFEVRSVETIGRNYGETLKKWYFNFIKDSKAPDFAAAYPPRLIRLWNIFLAWSTIAASQGTATCYQIVAHKNQYKFPREKFVGENLEKDTIPFVPNGGSVVPKKKGE